MLRIKLARFGKTGQPSYRVVVSEKRDKRDGKYVAQIGFYNPLATPKEIRFDTALYNEWLKKGAQPTQTVAALFKKFTA